MRIQLHLSPLSSFFDMFMYITLKSFPKIFNLCQPRYLVEILSLSRFKGHLFICTQLIYLKLLHLYAPNGAHIKRVPHERYTTDFDDSTVGSPISYLIQPWGWGMCSEGDSFSVQGTSKFSQTRVLEASFNSYTSFAHAKDTRSKCSLIL